MKKTNLPAATLPLAGNEIIDIVQGGVSKRATAADAAAIASPRLIALEQRDALLDQHVLDHIPPKNILEPARIIIGKYLNTGAPLGRVLTAPDNAFRMYEMAVSPGEQFALSANAAMPTGIGFYATAADLDVVAGGYANTAGTAPRILPPAPAGATILRFTVGTTANPMPTLIQLERGAVATALEPWRLPIPRIRAKAVEESPAPDYQTLGATENLFDKDTMVRPGWYLLASGGTQGTPTNSGGNWGMSTRMAFPPNAELTISGIRGQTGIAFFSADADNAVIPGSYSAGAGTRTVRSPRDTAFVAIDLYRNTNLVWSDVKVEFGPNATPYKGAGTEKIIKRDMLAVQDGASVGGAVLNLTRSTANGSSHVETQHGNNRLRQNISPFRPRNHIASEAFNFSSLLFNGVVHQSQGDDDVAPFRMYSGMVIGGNHGWYASRCTVGAHGKTNVDVGSRWNDSTGGTGEWVIVDLPTNGQITMLNRGAANITLPSNATMTHIAGATNAANFNSGAVTNPQFYPAIINRRFGISVDDCEVRDYGAQYALGRGARFGESYDVTSKETFLVWLIARVGTVPDIVDYGGSPDFSFSQSYECDRYGGWAFPMELLAHVNIPNFTDVMFAQAQPLNAGVAGPVRYLVPNSLPFTEASVNYDFTRPYDMTAYIAANAGNGLNFLVASRCAATGNLVDNVIMFNDAIFVAIGMLPVLDAAPSVRRTHITDKAVFLSKGGKAYVHLIDDVAGTGTRQMNAGECFTAVSYRVAGVRGPDRLCHYIVRSAMGDFLYVYWDNMAKIDRVPLPPDMHGRKIILDDKSANVTLRSEVATSTIAFEVNALGAGAYFRCRLERL